MSVFVIMLDDYIDSFPFDWPISAEGSSADEVRQHTQHDGNPQLRPKLGVQFAFVETKSLIHTVSGRVDRGGIYRSL